MLAAGRILVRRSGTAVGRRWLFEPPRSKPAENFRPRWNQRLLGQGENYILVGICSAGGLLWFSLHSVLVQHFLPHVWNLDKCGVEFLEFLYDTVQATHLDDIYKQLDLAHFYVSPHTPEPATLGSLTSRFGAHIVLPAHYQWENPEKLGDQELCLALHLDYERLKGSSGRLAELHGCLELSRDAKRYSVTMSLHSSWLPSSPYLDSTILMLVPYLSHFAAGKIGLAVAPLFIAGLFYLNKLIQFRFGHWAMARYESPELQRGAEEFVTKLARLEEIEREFSTGPTLANWQRIFRYLFRSSTFYPAEQQARDVKRFQEAAAASGGLGWAHLLFP